MLMGEYKGMCTLLELTDSTWQHLAPSSHVYFAPSAAYPALHKQVPASAAMPKGC